MIIWAVLFGCCQYDEPSIYLNLAWAFQSEIFNGIDKAGLS